MFASDGDHRRERATYQRAHASLGKSEAHRVGAHVAAVVQHNKVALVCSRICGPRELVRCDAEGLVRYLMPTVGEQYVSDAGDIDREAHGLAFLSAWACQDRRGRRCGGRTGQRRRRPVRRVHSEYQGGSRLRRRRCGGGRVSLSVKECGQRGREARSVVTPRRASASQASDDGPPRGRAGCPTVRASRPQP